MRCNKISEMFLSSVYKDVTASRDLNFRVTWLFNVMEWGILMAITEDMTSNTLQQRMIPKKTKTKTLVKILYN